MASNISVGSRVSHTYENAEGESKTEYGVVVHIWFNEEIQCDDAYIAFFGDGFPAAEPTEKPCILRYAVKSIKPVN